MPLYNYVQEDANLFGLEVTISGKTNADWLTYNTSIEYLSKSKRRLGIYHSFSIDV